MKAAKNPRLDQSTQKNEMETSDENRIVTGWKMGSESSWMEPWVQHEIRAVGRPRKRWADEINDFLRWDRTEDATKKTLKETNIGWIKTAKDQKEWMKMESKFTIARTGGWYDTRRGYDAVMEVARQLPTQWLLLEKWTRDWCPVEHTFTLRALWVKDCQRDNVVKNSERLLTEEDDPGTPDEWILDSGRGSLLPTLTVAWTEFTRCQVTDWTQHRGYQHLAVPSRWHTSWAFAVPEPPHQEFSVFSESRHRGVCVFSRANLMNPPPCSLMDSVQHSLMHLLPYSVMGSQQMPKCQR